MKSMSIDEKRDAILFFIKQKTELTAEVNDKYIWNLYINRTPELQIDQLLFHDILNQLERDNLLSKSPDDTYHLTVEGRMFKGYRHQNSLVNKIFSKGVKEGIVYTLIATVILAVIGYLYHRLTE